MKMQTLVKCEDGFSFTIKTPILIEEWVNNIMVDGYSDDIKKILQEFHPESKINIIEITKIKEENES